jgi:hypothetical protein
VAHFSVRFTPGKAALIENKGLASVRFTGFLPFPGVPGLARQRRPAEDHAVQSLELREFTLRAGSQGASAFDSGTTSQPRISSFL